MIKVRKSKDRGHFDFGWLNTYHTFSFGEYHDVNFRGFRNLRVINEDLIQKGKGFPTHSHWDMEILTYVISGALAHKDSMGNGSTINPGDIQYMSAGTGVEHSEYSASKTTDTHILQIWILTEKKGLPPLYGQKFFATDLKKNKLCLIASGTGENESVQIRQDVRLYASLLEKEKVVPLALGKDRHAWIQVIHGEVTVNGSDLLAGDGAAVSDEVLLSIRGVGAANEFLVFDLN